MVVPVYEKLSEWGCNRRREIPKFLPYFMEEEKGCKQNLALSISKQAKKILHLTFLGQ
ncbi:hypothetical protein P4T20_14635 [Aneurinibacillus thermoaerophilus]|uniref:hypothetical protein n=1 Tax=Aneurinibacillus thermoaerophilus TaxID=143495 RepID=UPI002E21B658|nr:hypothetical protein [Aneurinibacillus thermoaerophilus]